MANDTVRVWKEISSCQSCFHCRTEITKGYEWRLSYGYGMAKNYRCGAKLYPELIAMEVKTADEMPGIPDWCPFRVKED